MNNTLTVPGTTGGAARLAGGLAAVALLLTGCSGGGAPAEEDRASVSEPSAMATAHGVPRSEPSPAAGPEGPADPDPETAEPTPEAPADPEPAPGPGPGPGPAPTVGAAPEPAVELPGSVCDFPDPTMNAVCRSALGR
ncbi:hypothetical protein SAMN06297387_103351 [Streptomyces zhaozhouensis]|uniref:Uncharacterized protein n=1 Tax=Streptomyces zhaozhouensis TaxID=1300267 RepID=A0A286DT10_9ACTN|nr:hypothetical protein [Streptomyces zhaozhouensis]SOD61743.1 hypothetical protein SAMN06297387_103351 [Streptomyces zhaozhouensis]